jgi:hypothetical protein
VRHASPEITTARVLFMICSFHTFISGILFPKRTREPEFYFEAISIQNLPGDHSRNL